MELPECRAFVRIWLRNSEQGAEKTQAGRSDGAGALFILVGQRSSVSTSAVCLGLGSFSHIIRRYYRCLALCNVSYMMRDPVDEKFANG